MWIHIPELLSPASLSQVQALLADATWEGGERTAGAQAVQVKNNLQLPATSPIARALQSHLLDALEKHPLFFAVTLPKKVFPPLFNRHGGAHNAYGNHVDQALRYVPGSGQRVRTDLSCTVFLSDPTSYDGGELVIADTIGEQRVKLAAGDAVVYPATRVHRVEPVTRGERLASFFWIESLVRCEAQRRLLFDFDRQVTRLRERHGETDEAVALTGTYHNLLRHWADT